MRFAGTITCWKDARGFGFITPRGGGESVFLHVKAIRLVDWRPQGGEQVTYELQYDEKGRRQAVNVLPFITTLAPEPTPNRMPVVVVGLALLASVVTWFLVRHMNLLVCLAPVVSSALAYVAYAYDKDQAKRDGWRVSERTLHLLSLLGGWPGALIAQHTLRHKLRKPTFMILYWLTVIVNTAVTVSIGVAQPL